MKVISSSMNHGNNKEIMATVTCSHEVEIKVSDIITLLDGGSDNLAKIFNQLGSLFNRHEVDEYWAIKDLNADGKLLIENMAFFLEADNGRN